MRARGAAGLIGGRRDLAKLRTLLASERLDILLDVPAKRRTAAAEILSAFERSVGEIEDIMGITGSDTDTLFPSQLVAVKDAMQEVVQRRNAMGKRTNFDGAFQNK